MNENLEEDQRFHIIKETIHKILFTPYYISDNFPNSIFFLKYLKYLKMNIQNLIIKYGFENILCDYLKIITNTINVTNKIIERRECKNYSTTIKFSKKCRINSGFKFSDFDIVKKSEKKNWIDPISTFNKGFTRKESKVMEIFKDVHNQNSPFLYCINEYAPFVTSYVYYTEKRVVLILEDKVYQCQNAGKKFIFEELDNGTFVLTKVNIKNEKTIFSHPLTAMDIVNQLPKIRLELNLKQKNYGNTEFERKSNDRKLAHIPMGGKKV